jgi:hypothetical protein
MPPLMLRLTRLNALDASPDAVAGNARPLRRRPLASVRSRRVAPDSFPPGPAPGRAPPIRA